MGIYPVDILEDDPERHLEATLGYYVTLREGIRSSVEVFCLPTGEQIKLEASSVCFCTMYRDEPQHKILALVNPQDTKTVVAVYIQEAWWATEDVLRTSDPAREGLMKVQSFGERIVLFILNVVIFGRLERNLDDGDMKGSLCGDGPGACYLLPVFDTVFVRRTYRRQGLGTAMLQDFCETFREDEALGVSWPISPAMFKGKKERTSGEREQTKSDEDCGVEEAAGQLGRACGAEPARKEAKRTVLDAGLAWESQKKHVRPAPNSQTPS
ncbi:soluble lamin-associated protein of 75 kDa isoform X1 [Prionailurus iriomotensis]